MNKKATGLNMSIRSVVGLILGIVVLFLVLDVGGAIMNLFFPDVSKLTEESLESLDTIINGLEIGQNTSALFYMSKRFQLVAFDMGDNDGSGDLDVFERPPSCFNKACLVICKSGVNENSCKESEFVKTYDSFEFFEETDPDSGIITLVSGEYVNLHLELKENVLVLKEEEK